MKKLLSTTLAVGIFASMSLTPAFADVSANTLPGISNAAGAVQNAYINDTTVNANGNHVMNITIGSNAQNGQGGAFDVGSLKWDTYNIGSNGIVNYEFTNHNQTAINRVEATGGVSQIYGQITNSGCAGCGYAGSGKVILINPNGVVFGTGAAVNLNSFTVSNMDGTYGQDANGIYTLNLNQASTPSATGNYGIVVQEGANIYGDKSVAFASNNNITIYNGSKIKTSTVPNGVTAETANASYGKVKLITADGVNFSYYNNGGVGAASNFVGSNNRMTLQLNGTVEAGSIDARNYSAHKDSQINVNNAVLKATKAVENETGNIWLTATNDVIIGGSKFETVNAAGAANRADGGDVRIIAGKKLTFANGSNIKAVGNVLLQSDNLDINVANASVDAAKNVEIKALNGTASIQTNAKVKAGENFKMTAQHRAQVVDGSKVEAKNVEMTANNIWFRNSEIKAADTVKITALDDDINAENIKLTANGIELTAAKDVTGEIDLSNSDTSIIAGNDINVKLAGANSNKGLTTQSKNMNLEAEGTLSVSSLVTENDMNLKAASIKAGSEHTQNYLRAEGDSATRGYIEVGGTFTSNPNYTVTDSDIPTADGQYNTRHHIYYNTDAEPNQILLVTKLGKAADDTNNNAGTQTASLSVDGQQAQMLYKLQRQPETFSNRTAINNTKTALVDVFAAASQIEIEEEEEE